MKKNGKIPPHFLYFLENEGIEIIDFKSSNFSNKDSYDRLIVKFPYSVKTLDIQVIFDNLDYSVPPDFILINQEKLAINYEDIIREWNFKESSTLYNALNRIKECYSLFQEKKLREETLNAMNSKEDLQHIQDFHDNLNINRISGHDDMYHNEMSIFEYIDQMITKLKSRFSSYKQIPKSSCFLDIVFNYGDNNFSGGGSSNQQGGGNIGIQNGFNNANDYSSNLNSQNIINVDEKYSNHVIISYPIDIYIRSRNINRAPIINICIPLTYDMKFYIDVKTPHFVSISDFRIAKEFYNLQNFYDYILKYENYLFDYFRDMQVREAVITRILESNIGFPLEVDTYSYSKFSLYFNYNKNYSGSGSNSMSMANTNQKGKTNSITSTPGSAALNNSGGNSNPPTSNIPTPSQNLILHFNFLKDEKKLEFQIINCDLLRMLIKRKFDYGTSDIEINNILHSVLQSVLDIIQNKKK